VKKKQTLAESKSKKKPKKPKHANVDVNVDARKYKTRGSITAVGRIVSNANAFNMPFKC
jgi:hypothetical protein